jgi:hypothetical protein
MPWVREVLLIQRPESAAGAVRTPFGAIGGAVVVLSNFLAG